MKKVCSRCKKEKEISNFTYKGNGKYRSECKECRRLEYKNNPEKRAEVLMRAKRYYQEHKEEVKNKSKLRRRESKEREERKTVDESYYGIFFRDRDWYFYGASIFYFVFAETNYFILLCKNDYRRICKNRDFCSVCGADFKNGRYSENVYVSWSRT